MTAERATASGATEGLHSSYVSANSQSFKTAPPVITGYHARTQPPLSEWCAGRRRGVLIHPSGLDILFFLRIHHKHFPRSQSHLCALVGEGQSAVEPCSRR